MAPRYSSRTRSMTLPPTSRSASPQLAGRDADLTVVIVTYRVPELVESCLRSVRAAIHGRAIDVHVVDNGSFDGTVEMIGREFPEARLVDARENLGFIRGNNVVLDELLAQQSCGRYLLLLNPDTVVEPETFDVMLDFMETHPEAGAATCRVDLASGGLDWASHRGFPTPWSALTYMAGLEALSPKSRLFGGYHMRWLDLRRTHEIDCPTGAFFLVRREVFEAVGGLDTDYFMYGDDLDWALRIKRLGWRIYYHPATRIVHYKGVSTGLKGFSRQWSHADTTQRLRRNRDFFHAMRVFYDKHYAPSDRPLLRRAVRAGIVAAREARALRYRAAALAGAVRERVGGARGAGKAP